MVGFPRLAGVGLMGISMMFIPRAIISKPPPGVEPPVAAITRRVLHTKTMTKRNKITQTKQNYTSFSSVCRQPDFFSFALNLYSTEC